jgi:MFS transporter, DHA1 family, multidrug resistance protein
MRRVKGTAQRSIKFQALCAMGLLSFISYDLIRSPLLPLFARELGADPESIGLIVGASTITGILIKLPAGTLSDYLGRPRMLLAGLCVFAFAPLLYGSVQEIWQLIMLRFFHGLATGIFAPVSMAVVADLFERGRGEAMGWYTAFAQAGRLSGRVLGGYLIMWAGFGWAFQLSAMAGVVALTLFLLFNRADGQGNRQAHVPAWSSREQLILGLKQVAGDVRILVTSGMEAFQMLASGALMAFLPLYGISVGLNAGQVGLLFGVQGLSSVFIKPVMGRLSDRWGRRPMIVSGQVVCAGIVILIPWLESFWLLLSVSFLFGFGEAVIGSSTSVYVADLCRVRSLGSAMGVFGTVMDVGHASGPILSGFLITFLGYRGGFGIIGSLLVLMSLVFILISKDARNGAEKGR